ncbi:unnamed protein product [Peniophora sp. CBMAI 1063]|nr:unnamed protein product [Peniophora sp. CBMAI 1063]
MSFLPPGLQLMDDCAQYAVDCYIKAVANDLGRPCPVPVSPDTLPDGFQKELRVLAYRVAEAMANPYMLPWDALTYSEAVGGQDGRNDEFEASLKDRFHPLELQESLSRPSAFVDTSGKLQGLYLPNVILDERQDQVADAAALLRPTINAHPPKETDPTLRKAWRDSRLLFAVDDRDLCFGRGSATLSPGWLSQGLEGLTDPIHVSRDLGAKSGKRQNQRQQLAQAWVGESMELGLLLSSALAIAHPQQYQETKFALAALAADDDHREYMRHWAFAFNVITVIANRMTPLHRDRASGGRELFDALLSIGGGRRTTLSLPGIGARLQYDSGTLVLMHGSVHPHEVSPFEMERLCIACYARPAVLRQLGRQNPEAPTAEGTMPAGWWPELVSRRRPA